MSCCVHDENDAGESSLVLRFDDHAVPLAGGLVDLLAEGDVFLDVDELDLAVRIGQNGVRIRIPAEEDLALSDRLAVLDEQVGAVGHVEPRR